MESYKPPEACGGCFEKQIHRLKELGEIKQYLGETAVIPLCPIVAGALVGREDRPTLKGIDELSATSCRALQERGDPMPVSQVIRPERLEDISERLSEILIDEQPSVVKLAA